MDMELIALVAGVLALIIGGLAYYRSGKPLTFDGLINLLSGSRTLAEQIGAVAKVVVSAIEQLKDTGKIKTNEEAFDTAMEYLKAWFPGVEPELLVPFVEDAYRGLKAAKGVVGAMQKGSFTISEGTELFTLGNAGIRFSDAADDASAPNEAS